MSPLGETNNRFYVKYNFVPPALHIVGAVKIKNKCCPDEAVLITQTNGKQVFSCQCACGGWCTTGCTSIQDALTVWEEMCE